MKGITLIIGCTGTTAFPSGRWEFKFSEMPDVEKLFPWERLFFDQVYRQTLAQNGHQQVDVECIKALIQTTPKALQKFALVSSVGVTRREQPPFSILNSFAVLNAKAKGEGDRPRQIDGSEPFAQAL